MNQNQNQIPEIQSIRSNTSYKRALNSLIIVCATAATLASYADDPRYFQTLKPLTTILIILLPLLFTDNSNSEFSKYRALIIIALGFCLAGDIFLLHADYFVFGLASFLSAHLLFAFVFYKLSNSDFHLLPLSVLLVIAVAYYTVLLPNLGSMALPVAIYFVCIVVMCWQGLRLGLSLGFKNKRGLLVSLAAVLFVVSDSIIAADKFLVAFDASGALILALYWASITLMANFFSGSSIALKNRNS